MSRVFPIVLATIITTSTLTPGLASAAPATVTTASSGVVGSVAEADDDVAAKVKAALQADPELGSQVQNITITGTGGIITLEGTAPSVQIRAKVGEFVKKAEGVTKVINKMKLAKQ